jgi:sulfatase maturation enzyme AslB (radical SAM superfamily)
MLTGGEPTYIPQVKYLLEKIVYDNYDLDVLITTNASFTDNFWFELTRKFKRLHWTISLDAVGPAAEIIRHGTDWSTIENNIVWLSTHAHSLNFNTVVSNLNVLHLKPLLKFVNQMKKKQCVAQRVAWGQRVQTSISCVSKTLFFGR